ncbi:MAG: Asp23/Gls24 family envelope stress response protein [Thermoleophilia bacterium]
MSQAATVEERRQERDREPRSELQTERGTTRIADVVVAKVASIATREVSGVHDMGGSTSRALGAVTERVGMSDSRQRGVSVEVGEREAVVDLVLIVEYGESIPNVARDVRENVVRRVEGTTGLRVTEVNIEVVDLFFEGDDSRPREG